MSKHELCGDVAAVLVTHNPNLDALCAAIEAVASQVSEVFVVDNGSTGAPNLWRDKLSDECIERLRFLPQSTNLGIGAAHNFGIEQARMHGSAFVLLLDQDSQLHPGTVARLRSSYASLTKEGFRVAAVGPRYHDNARNRLSKFVRVGVFGFDLVDCKSQDTALEIDFLLSSGSLLPLSNLQDIGPMDESLFIDHVDTEWCFRAKAKGFQIFGVCDAVMTHALGEHRKEFWFTRQRMVPFHSPFRYYYMFRNSVLLYRRSYMPLAWKLADIQRCLKIAVFFGLVAPNRFACLKMMALGLIDGFKGVSGKKPERP